jgi:hypothetical protein
MIWLVVYDATAVKAAVLGTAPEELNFPLTLDNAELLPWDHPIQRVGEYSTLKENFASILQIGTKQPQQKP